jgi:CHAD domain-containing protein
MAFHFKKKESVPKGSRRLGRERIEHALECLEKGDQAEAVHCARKDIKKARAVVRLVRANLKKPSYRRIIDWLREAAQKLAGPRDAYVRLRTLEKLRQHFKGQLAPAALRQIHIELRHVSEEAMKRFTKKKTKRSATRTLRRGEKKFRLQICGKEWKALGPGVKRTYAAGRRAYQEVLQNPAPENFHRWRKRVKDLWYHVRLLDRAWPEQMEALAKELKTLSDHLGDDHDLVVLSQDIQEKGYGQEHPREQETLHALIGERQRELRAAALHIGPRLYAEKPAVFCDRLAGYWRIWRGAKKRNVVKLAATTA